VALEIERKFLVVNDGWKNSATRRVRIRDGLIASNNMNKVRVRVAGNAATIALKSQRRGLPVRNEFEYPIPLSDAEEMLRMTCNGLLLEKIRYFIFHASDIWHVDVYEGLLDGFVLAEIELTSVDQTFMLPDWIGAEVTSDPRYSKANMVADRLARTTLEPVTGRLPSEGRRIS
jgi:CYTH domain-containing protein